jgi:hypothetical protein
MAHKTGWVRLGQSKVRGDEPEPVLFKKVLMAGIKTANGCLSDGVRALQAGNLDAAESLWKKAYAAFDWILLNVMQRRVRKGLPVPDGIVAGVKALFMRMLIYGKVMEKAKSA